MRVKWECMEIFEKCCSTDHSKNQLINLKATPIWLNPSAGWKRYEMSTKFERSQSHRFDFRNRGLGHWQTNTSTNCCGVVETISCAVFLSHSILSSCSAVDGPDRWLCRWQQQETSCLRRTRFGISITIYVSSYFSSLLRMLSIGASWYVC